MKKLFEDIHKAFESKVRLGIMSILMMDSKTDFNTLKENLQLTDGNLASHLNALEAAGFITVKKQFIGRKPKTTYSATDKGREAFKRHLDALEQLIRQSKDGS